MWDTETRPPEPPPLASERGVVRLAGLGSMLATAAALVGIPNAGDSLDQTLTPLRALLSALGMLLAGCALTLNYRWPISWLLAAGTCALAGLGFPQSWDTFRLVAFVCAGVALLGSAMLALPVVWRMRAGSALVVLHFFGIFIAVTTPPPAPAINTYLSTIVFRPYLQFVYLGNAYQFYSPDPGPASELWFCIYYEPKVNDPVKMEVLQQTADGSPVKDRSGQPVYKPMLDAKGELSGEPMFDAEGTLIFDSPKDRFGNVLKRPITVGDEQQPDYLVTTKWIKIPKRHKDFKDPLGQSYYRRLSLTEQVSQFTPLTSYPPRVISALTNRRAAVASQIVFDDAEWPMAIQCRIPTHDATQKILPSYVRHLATENARADRPISAIKVYRVMHSIAPPESFVGGLYKGTKVGVDMKNPTTYLPYFVGEFNVKGELLNPADPLLYWLIPIRRNRDATPEDYRKVPESLADYKRLYEDFVYKHAQSHHMEGEFSK